MSNQASFFDKFSRLLEEKLGPVADFVANQKHILAMRNGVIASIPLSIVGGICLILAFPPIDPQRVTGTNFFTRFLLDWYAWASAHMAAILTPFAMTMGIMALFIAMAVGYSLSVSYKMNPLSGSILAATSFLLVAAPSQSAVLLSRIQDGMDAKGIAKLGQGVIPANFLDAKGIFTAIIVGLLAVEVARFMKAKGITIKMPDGVPPAVAATFESLFPMIANVFIFYMVSLFFQSQFAMLVPEAIMKAISPVVSAVDSAPGVFFLTVLAQLLWFMGLHGAAIVGGVAQPFWDANTLANAAAKVAGQPMEHIFTTPLWSFFICLGGSGATLAVIIMLLVSKSRQLKSTGQIALLPGLFNINEPITFGLPMVFNPILAIPFIFIEGINGVIAFYLTKFGIISPAFIIAPWTTPAPVGAFLATLDWKAGALVLIFIALDFVLYYPFFKLYEKQCLRQEHHETVNTGKVIQA
ncbi:phosphotransferase system eiic [Lucifera butyrica]|uniref:Permease IIC component n=1 Tax=Lucifera butyrica TaxID=1351585 RepID=A0A498R6F6_9FIRM|nr:PTS transporter subunit EIIC [Lucifera butyrica]VBB07064.1 phosphotransferase system eiic [Lucifera butyrica]